MSALAGKPHSSTADDQMDIDVPTGRVPQGDINCVLCLRSYLEDSVVFLFGFCVNRSAKERETCWQSLRFLFGLARKNIFQRKRVCGGTQRRCSLFAFIIYSLFSCRLSILWEHRWSRNGLNASQFVFLVHRTAPRPVCVGSASHLGFS